jgi:hypothetical protein
MPPLLYADTLICQRRAVRTGYVQFRIRFTVIKRTAIHHFSSFGMVTDAGFVLCS